MCNVMEDSVGFLLWLVRVMAQHPFQFFEVRVSKRGDAGGKGRRDVGSEEMEIVEGPLDALKDVSRNAAQEVVGEAIVCAEQTSSDGAIVPAGGRHDGREVILE